MGLSDQRRDGAAVPRRWLAAKTDEKRSYVRDTQEKK